MYKFGDSSLTKNACGDIFQSKISALKQHSNTRDYGVLPFAESGNCQAVLAARNSLVLLVNQGVYLPNTRISAASLGRFLTQFNLYFC